MTKIIVELNEKAHRNLVLAKSINHDKNYVQTLNRILENLDTTTDTDTEPATSESTLSNWISDILQLMKDDPVITNIEMSGDDPLPIITGKIKDHIIKIIKENPPSTNENEDDW